MAQPNLERIYLKLSQRIQDARATVGESDTGHDYTKLQLVQAINNGVKDFINKTIEEETIEKVAVILESYIQDNISINYDGTGYPLSNQYIKVINVEQSAVQGEYVKPENWGGVKRAYNPEENDTATLLWTQFNDYIYLLNFTLTPILVQAIKKHNDIALGDANDILLDDRFDSVILKLAEAEIQSYSPIV